MVGNSRRRPLKGFLILGVLIFLAAVSVMVVVPTARVLLEVGALAAGLLAGAGLVRFGVSRRWMSSLVLILFIAVWFALGSAGYAWFAGFFAGACGGIVWGRIVANQTLEPPAPWTVNGLGFDTVEEARLASGHALRSLDGKKLGHLAITHGRARFEVAGDAEIGMVCHRNADAGNEHTWAVLEQFQGVTDEFVEIPMGNAIGLMPSQLVHNTASVETEMAKFFRDPSESSFGPGWKTGSEAQATRLTTY